MKFVKPAIACAALALGSATSAHAADLIPIPEPLPPVEIEVFGGWYLRGDIGVSSQQLDEMHYTAVPAGTTVQTIDEGFDSAGFVGVGGGYRFNSWLRADVTAEYRAPARFYGLDRYDTGSNGTWDGTNDYSFTKTEIVGLVNAYLDLGTWWGVTPFVGVGGGVAHIMLDDFRDINVPTQGVAYAEGKSTTNFAWAAYAGLGYEVNDRLSLELAYRYLSMGDGKIGDRVCYDNTCVVPDSTTIKSITSHDFKVGMRWNLQGPAPVYGGPISRSF